MKYNETTRGLLIAAVKKSLGPDTSSHGEGLPLHGTALGFTGRGGALKSWFLHRLDGMVPMIKAPDVDERTLIQWIHVEGRSRAEVSRSIGIPETTIYDRMQRVFNLIVDLMTYRQVESVLGPQLVNWKLKGCPRCVERRNPKVGDLHREGDEWICFQCGHRIPTD